MLRSRWMGCVWLLCAWGMAWSTDPRWGSSDAVKLSPSFFVANTRHAKTGQPLIPNDHVVAFVQTRSGRVLFTPEGAFIGLPDHGSRVASPGDGVGKAAGRMDLHGEMVPPSMVVFKAGIASSSARTVTPRLAERMQARVNFFTGDSSSWRTNVPTFRKLVYDDALDGVSLEFLGFMDRLEYRLIARAGVDPSIIVLETGADSTHLDEQGRLIAEIGTSRLVFGKPCAFQRIDGDRIPVSVAYEPLDDGRFGFSLGPVDARYPLIIDPELTWSTFVGGDGASDSDLIRDVVLDDSGNVYFTGFSASSAFPTMPGSFDRSHNGNEDVVVGKLNPSGTQLVWSTYLGGSDTDSGYGVALDGTGGILVTGLTASTNFPTTSKAFDRTHNGMDDGFVARFTSAGGLVYSTYIGGSNDDSFNAVAALSSGSALVVGATRSSNYPTTPGAFDRTHNGELDAVITRLDKNGENLGFSTFFGGIYTESAMDLALDDSDQIYITGFTGSSDFPTSPDAYDSSFNGGSGLSDAYMARFSASGSAVYSTFLGGTSSDEGVGIGVDGLGNTYVTGTTYSSDFPFTSGAYDTTHNGWADVFVTKFDASGSSLTYSTFIGGAEEDDARDIAVDDTGYAYVAGMTESSGFPITPGVVGLARSLEAGFVCKLDKAGKNLLYSTFLSGSEDDEVRAIALDDDDSVVVAGRTESANFPCTSNALDNRSLSSDDSGIDGFISRLNADATDFDFSTFLRGHGGELGASIAVDGNGDVIVAGTTDSWVFPVTPGAHDVSYNHNQDVVVFKLNGTGHAMVYATYLGGRDQDQTRGVAVDASGCAFVVGSTQSTDFPTTPGAVDDSLDGSTDAFVTKLDASGASLSYSTFLGGTDGDVAQGVAVDGSGYAFVIGTTDSASFPTTSGAFDETHQGGDDAFITKLNVTGTGLVYSTFIGGESSDYGRDLALDAFGNVYACGYTTSNGFPVTSGAFDTFIDESYDAFVLKLNTTGSNLSFCSFLGEAHLDFAYGIALTAGDAPVVVGNTHSDSFPVTPGSADPTYNGELDGFVAQFNASGSGLVYATYVGGAANDSLYKVGLDSDGCAVLCGSTESGDFPTTSGALDDTLGGDRDGILVRLHSSGTFLTYSTYLGGDDDDFFNDLSLDMYGNAVVTGGTRSSDFPFSPDAYDETYGGDLDIVVARVSFCIPPAMPDPISGPDRVCQGEDGVNYTISPVAGATSYTWSVPTGAVIDSGQGTTSVSVDFGSDSGEVTVCAVDGCGSGPARILAVSVDAPPIIVSDPGNQDLCPGATATFDVVVNPDDGVDYQWFRNGTELSDDGRISGSSTASLEIALLEVSDQGNYHCEVGNVCDAVASTSATLTVDGPLQVRVEPHVAVKGVGSIELTAVVECAVPVVNYAWTLTPATPYSQVDPGIILDNPPLDPVTYVQAVITDPSMRETASDQAIILVSQNPLFYDVTGDGINDVEDLWETAQFWNQAFADDPNEDGRMDVRDLLFINLDDMLVE